jgi:hypothetical protein
MEQAMRLISCLTVGAFLLATSAIAAPMNSSALSEAASSSIQLVQATKDETIKQKVKRVWRNIAGTTYDVGCPTLAIAFNRTTCTETGKDSQAKCIAKHPVCQVSPQK